METLFAAVWWIVSTIFSVVLWIAWQLLWIVLWFILPVLIVAYVAMRAAEAVFGADVVRARLKIWSVRLGGGIWDRLRRLLVASSVLPFRVLFWFVVYAVWHSFISLFWTPRWRPWQRAWTKRWKPEQAKGTASGPTRAMPRRA